MLEAFKMLIQNQSCSDHYIPSDPRTYPSRLCRALILPSFSAFVAFSDSLSWVEDLTLFWYVASFPSMSATLPFRSQLGRFVPADTPAFGTAAAFGTVVEAETGLLEIPVGHQNVC